MRKKSLLLSSLICFTFLPELLLALPQEPSVAAGSVSVRKQNSHTMVIEASDKAIIQYKSFNINQGEKVRFIQPCSSSRVLNRVKGGDPSKILGKMESNGKVFLVNPNGVYFGPKSSVRAGSFIASTLNISDEDFVRENFSFFLENKNNLSEIRNDGLLAVAPEGEIVLISPIIRNYGMIQAKAGKVVLAAGEHVTLDFQGDKLLNFSVEGDLKGAVLEHLGSIQAEGGEVSMRLPTAKKAIREIVNREGLERGEVFIQEDGEIKLVSASYVLAKKVALEAGHLCVEGVIDASSSSRQGGEVFLSGTEISLKGALIDATGSSGGGQVLIGGEYQGLGAMPHSSKVSIDESTQILANAEERGNGGTVVLWSRESTSFEGYISATGGLQGGNGGEVETSSKGDLTLFNGFVDTSAALGSIGKWLLDPSTLTIVLGSDPNPGCVGGFIGKSTIESSFARVVLCANDIFQEVSLSMGIPGASLLFTAPPFSEGILHLKHDIETKAGNVVVNHLITRIENDIKIDTTSGGDFPAGGNILFNDNIDANGTPHALTLNSGLVGQMTLQDIGKTSPLGAVNFLGSGQVSIGSLFTASQPINVENPIYIAKPSVFSTASEGDGAFIALNTVDALFAGIGSFALSAGIGSVSIGNVGLNRPLGNFSILSGADGVNLADISTQGGEIIIIPSILLTQTKTLFKTFSGLNLLVSGGIRLGDVAASVPGVLGMELALGSVGEVNLGNLGSSGFELGDFSIKSNDLFEVKNIYARSFSLEGGAGQVNYNGEIRLLGPEGLRTFAADIQLGAPILVREIFLNSLTSIENKETNGSSVTVFGGGSVFMNAAFGSVGSLISPITLNATGPILMGGRTVNLAGIHSDVKYLPKNTPCFVNFKGVQLSCLIAPSLIFQQLPKDLFRSFFFNSMMLGIGYSPAVNDNTQWSALRPIQLTNNNLPALSNEKEDVL